LGTAISADDIPFVAAQQRADLNADGVANIVVTVPVRRKARVVHCDVQGAGTGSDAWWQSTASAGVDFSGARMTKFYLMRSRAEELERNGRAPSCRWSDSTHSVVGRARCNPT